MRDMPRTPLSEEKIAMSIDNFARWLSRVTLAVAIIMIGWGLSVIFAQPVTAWFSASTMIWMVLLLISAIWQLRGSFPAIAGAALATAVVSRLFSILRLNPPADIADLKPDDLDLLVAMGPGVPGVSDFGLVSGCSCVRPIHPAGRIRRGIVGFAKNIAQ